MNSKKFTLNKKDLKDVAVMVFFSALGAALMSLIEVLQQFDFGVWTPFVVAFVPVLTYTAKKFQQGK